MSKALCLCYLRLSNRGKQEVSIEMQRKRCELECERLALVPVFYEEGLGKHSANTRKRLPEWDKLLQRAVSDPDVYAVMAYDHERAFRNVTAARVVADELAEAGVKLIFTISGEVDNKTASGKMMYTIHAAFSEHYSNYVSEKLQDHFAALKSRGIYAGHRAPQGLKRVGKAPDVSFEVTPQLAVIVAWLELYTARDIGTNNGAVALNGRGLRWITRTGNARLISPYDLQYVLEILDTYRPFLPPGLYRAARQVKASRVQHRANGRQLVNPPHLLRGVLACGLCGAPYVCTTQPDRYGNIHGYYRHRPPVLCGNVVKPSVRKVDALVWERVRGIAWSPELVDALVARLILPTVKAAALDVSLLREKLERRLKNYQQMLADEDITRLQFLSHKAEIEGELDALPVLAQEPDEPITEGEARRGLETLIAALDPDAPHNSPEDRNRAMRGLFERVTVAGVRGNYDIEVAPQPLFAEVFATSH